MCLYFSILSWTTCLADAWVLPPSKQYGHRYQSNLKLPRPSSVSTPDLRSFAALQSSVDNDQDLEITSAPVLRTPYDPPPRIDHEKKAKDASPTISAATSLFVTEVVNGTLSTEDGSPHVLYYEVHHRIPVDALVNESIMNGQDHDVTSKRERGLTALVLHGGPGAGCFPRHANFFSPEFYEYVVLLDQRGCGKSVPLGEVSMNTLPLLVQDVERLRRHLLDVHGENRPWDCILGGSWGCTLALAYAHSFPSRVRSMVLRGVCLFRPKEIDWLFGDPPINQHDDSRVYTSNLRELVGGSKSSRGKSAVIKKTPTNAYLSPTNAKDSPVTASQLFSQAWKAFSEEVDASTKSREQTTTQRNRSVLLQYYHRLLGSNALIRARAAQSWFRWEMGIYSSGLPKQSHVKTNDNNTELLVWNPATQTWHHEDAKVWNNRSVTSIDNFAVDGDHSNLHPSVDESVVQSLRRYSKPPTERTPEEERSPTQVQPIRVENVALDEASAQPISSSVNSMKQSQPANTTFDPANFIPAQAMLTCHYCTNDDYVLHPYRSFLSLSSHTTSWYASRIPPSPTIQSSSQPLPSITGQSFPLPPCIAIQGGLDAICPPDTALDLHHSWKELELRIALESGHSMYDPVIAGEIVKALDRFGQALLKEQKETARGSTYCGILRSQYE